MKKISFRISVAYLAVLLLTVLFYSLRGFDDALVQNVDQILATPNYKHWFGTDSLGRDLFVRVIMGGRVSIFVSIVCSFIIALTGFLYGSAAGWFGGLFDSFFMRVCDIFSAIPSFVLVSVVSLFLQISLDVQDADLKAYLSLCLGISATHWMSLARVVRGLVREIKQRPFVEAAIALGGTQGHILFRHVLPNIIGTIFILVAIQIPNNIMYESFMSFVGLGIQPPETSWGILIREGWRTLSSFPHLLLLPALVLFITVLSLNVVLQKAR